MTRFNPVDVRNSWAAGIEINYDEPNDRLVWSPRQADQQWYARNEVGSESGMLSDFSRLNDKRPERILHYARSRGVLGICEHDLPASHSLSSLYMFGAEEAVRCHPLGWPQECYESLETWRQLSRLMGAFLLIGTALQDDTVGGAEEWQTVFAENSKMLVILNQGTIPLNNWVIGQEYVEPVWERDVNTEWQIIASAIRILFSWGGVGISFRKSDGQSSVILDSPGLFGALAVELMYSLFSDLRLENCSACGRIYFPKRAPRPGERSYCDEPKCRRVRSQRLSKAYRERKKS